MPLATGRPLLVETVPGHPVPPARCHAARPRACHGRRPLTSKTCSLHAAVAVQVEGDRRHRVEGVGDVLVQARRARQGPRRGPTSVRDPRARQPSGSTASRMLRGQIVLLRTPGGVPCGSRMSSQLNDIRTVFQPAPGWRSSLLRPCAGVRTLVVPVRHHRGAGGAQAVVADRSAGSRARETAGVAAEVGAVAVRPREAPLPHTFG